MKTIICFIIGFFLILPVFSQNNAGKTGATETITSEALKFFIDNPPIKGNGIDPTTRAVVSTLSKILGTIGDRKHAVNLVAAGANKMTINNNLNAGQFSPSITQDNSVLISTPNGQAVLFEDNQGKIFILYEGKVYPISEELVNQAKEFSLEKVASPNKILHPYSLENVKDDFLFEPRPDKLIPKYFNYKVYNKYGEYISDIAKSNGVPDIDLKIIAYPGNDTKKKFKEIYDGREKLPKGSVVTIKKMVLSGEFLPTVKVNFIFTCKWVNDFGEDGYQFEDFQSVRNCFYLNEDITIVTGYRNDSSLCGYILSILDYETGELLLEKAGDAESGDIILPIHIENIFKKEGVYLINFRLREDLKVLSSKTEKFEIIETKE
jgi:hypothetical protein